jgi:hypothetical protein
MSNSEVFNFLLPRIHAESYLPPPLTTSSLDTYITSILLSLGLLIPDDGGSTHL